MVRTSCHSLSSDSEWIRVGQDRRCPVCGRPDWCLYSGPPDRPNAVICARIDSAKRCGDAGWLHQSQYETDRPARRYVGHFRVANLNRSVDFGLLAQRYADAAGQSEVSHFAATLGVSSESLQRLMLGWSDEHRAWSFPMRAADGTVVGIRLRAPSGRKYAAKGSREGLFIPTDLDGSGQLLILEGPTDTAALLDLGFQAVGRPSCMGGARHLIALIKLYRPPEVVIVADADPPGKRGADSLASKLVAYARTVRVIAPPDGIKDAREWKRQGGTREAVLDAIERTEARQLEITISRR